MSPLEGLKQVCKQCGSIMHKAGFRWSGKERIQAYQCPACGHVTTTPNYVGPGGAPAAEPGISVAPADPYATW
jgi:uncharacterized OB-fold protein